jgi:hypothetical protein
MLGRLVRRVLLAAGEGKEYAWSRGLGIEHSPIKTRSARKKSATLSSLDSTTPSTSDGGALRAVKALAWEK